MGGSGRVHVGFHELGDPFWGPEGCAPLLYLILGYLRENRWVTGIIFVARFRNGAPRRSRQKGRQQMVEPDNVLGLCPGLLVGGRHERSNGEGLVEAGLMAAM